MSYLGWRSLRLDLTAARLQLLQWLRRHSQPFFERRTRSARTHRSKAWPRQASLGLSAKKVNNGPRIVDGWADEDTLGCLFYVVSSVLLRSLV